MTSVAYRKTYVEFEAGQIRILRLSTVTKTKSAAHAKENRHSATFRGPHSSGEGRLPRSASNGVVRRMKKGRRLPTTLGALSVLYELLKKTSSDRDMIASRHNPFGGHRIALAIASAVNQDS